MPNKWHRYLGYENQKKKRRKSSPHHLIINNCFNYNCNKKGIFLLLEK